MNLAASSDAGDKMNDQGLRLLSASGRGRLRYASPASSRERRCIPESVRDSGLRSKMCNPCARTNLLPIYPTAQIWHEWPNRRRCTQRPKEPKKAITPFMPAIAKEVAS